MRKLSIEYIENYLISNNCGFHLIENQKYIGSKAKLFYRCDICNEEEPFLATFNDIVQGDRCPYCAGQKVKKRNTLKYLFPEIALEWDYEKNYPLIPEDVVAGSGKKRFWICKKCGEGYGAEVYNRTYSKTECPFCSVPIRKVGKRNNLKFLFPEIALEWNFEKNYPLLPENITSHSDRKIWWKCLKCQYEWQSRVADRIISRGCHICSHEIPSPKYNLETEYPEIAIEWDYEKNHSFKPSDVLPSSARKFYWICPDCERYYLTDPSHRTGKDRKSCPFCPSSKAEKKIKGFLEGYNICFESQKRFDDCKDIRSLPFDFFFPNFNCALEVQGQQHYFPVRFGGIDIETATKNFEKSIGRDRIKFDYCKNNNMKLIEIPYWNLDKIEDILIKEFNLTSEERRI